MPPTYTDSWQDQCQEAATYHGSYERFHGPVFVTLDWEAIDHFGETRYVVIHGEYGVLRQVRAASVSFEPVEPAREPDADGFVPDEVDDADYDRWQAEQARKRLTHNERITLALTPKDPCDPEWDARIARAADFLARNGNGR